MKKYFTLAISLLFTLPLMATANNFQESGKEFCNDIIDPVSRGSNHVMVCWSTVDELIKKGVTSENQLFRAICEKAPTFPYSDNGMTEQECLKSAAEEGYLSANQ